MNERKKTHAGRANGVTLMSGCELSVRRWVRDPFHAARLQQEGGEHA